MLLAPTETVPFCTTLTEHRWSLPVSLTRLQIFNQALGYSGICPKSTRISQLRRETPLPKRGADFVRRDIGRAVQLFFSGKKFAPSRPACIREQVTTKKSKNVVDSGRNVPPDFLFGREFSSLIPLPLAHWGHVAARYDMRGSKADAMKSKHGPSSKQIR
jgi:hypothetical protein